MGANSGSLANFKKTSVKDTDLNKVQQNVENAITTIINKEIIDGVLLKNVCLHAGTANAVKHQLGRAIRGWIVVRLRADARIWDVQDFNPNPARTLMLACSHDAKVDLWVF